MHDRYVAVTNEMSVPELQEEPSPIPQHSSAPIPLHSPAPIPLHSPAPVPLPASLFSFPPVQRLIHLFLRRRRGNCSSATCQERAAEPGSLRTCINYRLLFLSCAELRAQLRLKELKSPKRRRTLSCKRSNPASAQQNFCALLARRSDVTQHSNVTPRGRAGSSAQSTAGLSCSHNQQQCCPVCRARSAP